MKSVKESMTRDLSKFGIESSVTEPCTECNYKYAVRVVITKTDGTVTSYCKYCEDQRLVESLNIPKSKDDRLLQKMRGKAKYFSRIPEDVKDAKLNDYKAVTDTQKKAKNQAVDFVTQFDKKKSLILSGDPGIGKTHIAVAVANALAKDNSVLFLKSTNLLDLIKESYSNDSYSEMDVMELCRDVDLLVIDDLGAEYSKPGDSESWASDIIYKAIDSRLDKSLIITTNYSESLLEQKYGFNGKRITSRMSDNATKIRMVGTDMRRERRE